MSLQDVLGKGREEILRRFVNEVRRSDLVGAAIERPLLLNGIPEFLDRVITALSGAEPTLMKDAHAETAAATGAEHGHQRWELGYDARELVREYGILHDVTLGLLAEKLTSVDLDEYRVFSRHISLGVAEAVGQLMDDRDAAIAKTSAEQFAFLAHELRGPLMVALLCMEVWQDGSPPSSESIADASESLHRLARSIDESIVSSRVQSGSANVSATIKPFDIEAAIKDVLRAMVPVAAARGVRLQADVVPTGLTVRGDRRLLDSALGNLVSNAVKFTHAHTSVQIRARIEGNLCRIVVEDECGGLPPGAAARAFEPFVQLSSDRSGFGLGLAIARQAVEAHGGRVLVEDRPGHGCQFTLEFPQTEDADGPAPAPEPRGN